MEKPIDNQYINPDRLSDVIRLLIVLSVDKYSFRTESGLNDVLRDSPRSAELWLTVANDHPEFFRSNKEKTAIILLIRYLQKPELEDGDLRPPLSVDETQKLVDQAIALHDKQLARYQRDSYKTAINAAYIAAAATVVASIISWVISTNETKDLQTEIQIIQTKLDDIRLFGLKNIHGNEGIYKVDSLKKN